MVFYINCNTGDYDICSILFMKKLKGFLYSEDPVLFSLSMSCRQVFGMFTWKCTIRQ